MNSALRSLLNRDLAVRALKLALPVGLAYVCLASVMGIEIWAVGSLGPEAIAGVGLGSWLFIVLLMAFHCLELGCQTIVARRFGAKEWARIGATLDNALVLAVVIGLVLTLGLWHSGPFFLHSRDPIVHGYALSYFRIRLLSLPVLLVLLTLIGFYNGIGRPQIAMYAFGLSGVVNLTLLYVLVLGGLGLEPMGVEGAAWASVWSIYCGALVMIVPLIPHAMRSRYSLFRIAHLSWSSMRSLIALSTPIFVQNLSVHIALFLFIRINAMLGTMALAVTNIALAVGNFSYLPAVGCGVAAAALVSQSLGGRNPVRARIVVVMCVTMALIYMVSVGLALIVGGRWIMELFVDRSGDFAGASSEIRTQVIDSGTWILRLVGALQFFDAMGLVFSKALQGAGLTRFVMVCEIILYWGILLPLASVMGLVLGMGVMGTWLGFGAFLIAYGLIMVWKFRKGDWIHGRV